MSTHAPSSYRFSGPFVLRLLGVVVAGVGLLVLVLATLAAVLSLPPVVLGAGMLVAAVTVAGERCVVLRLRDGRTSTVPVGLLAGRTEDFVEDLRGHLNRGHGYRPVPGLER